MGLDKLKLIQKELTDIKVYLRKLGPDRRNKGDILQNKVTEAKELFAESVKIIKVVNEKFSNDEISHDDVEEIIEIKGTIHTLYIEILEYFDTTPTTTLSKMTTFDLKVAVSLLPVLDGNEEKTRQLIDAIQLYESMIDDVGKTNLINFVLKTRFNQNAKLRLSQTYATVRALVEDMRKHLLTRKSDTALQSKLINTIQGNKSVENFGKELEELFIELTISQAEGNNNAYAVLKPINERNAIKRFADGLRDKKLSTIIAARNFDTLKDAIRSALDEELEKRPDQQIMTYNKFNNYQRGYNQSNSNRSRGYNHSNSYRSRGYNHINSYRSRGHNHHTNSNRSRGVSYFNSNNKRQNFSRQRRSTRGKYKNYVNFAEVKDNEENNEVIQFFREDDN